MPAPEAVNGDLVGGGSIIATGAPATSYGQPIALNGDSVTSHGIGPHAAATIVATQFQYLVNGKAVCRIGDVATCGDPITPGPSNQLTVIVGP